MYIPLLATLSLAHIAQAGSISQFNVDSCSVPEREVLLTLSPGLAEHIHGSGSCSQHPHQVHINTIPSPWTEPVKCIPKENTTERYCVYSNANFANGRGISFFTTPAIADTIAALPVFVDPKPHLYDRLKRLDDSPWEVRIIPGKGKGLFATRELHRGDRILADTAVGVYHMNALVADSKLDYIYLHTAFIQLPKGTQQLFLNTMASSAEGDPIMERINTNAFSGAFHESSHYLMYPETALLNHACRPNAMYYYDPKTLVHSTEAARTIQAGEEITIPYTNILASRAERQKALNSFWGFKCTCSLCSATDLEVAASNTRLERIMELQKELSDWTPWSNGTPAMAEELITLYEEEHLHAAKAPGHTLAAQSFNAVGNTRMARWHAEYALEAGMITVGPDQGDESMKQLLDDPKAHWSYNVRKHKTEL